MPFDELRTIHKEIGALLAQKRHEALEELRQKASLLGFSSDDFAPKKKKGNGHATAKYRNIGNPDETWSGRGKRPAWLTDKLEAGHQLEEFLI